MSKTVQELSEKYAEDHCETIRDVKEYNNYCDLANGFMGAMELQLPVKFAVWVDEWDNWKSLDESMAIPQLFDYWIKNVYTP